MRQSCADNEVTFNADLRNASQKEAVYFVTLLKNKPYYVTNPRVNTRIKRDIIKFQYDSDIIENQSDLCRNAIESDTKNLPLFYMILGNLYDHTRQIIQEWIQFF